jgi:cell division septum initiation protein DivIVA/outer membrane biosynthesis protein TonB
MAAPSRFDPSSPASVAGATFSNVRKGFAPDEVRAALTSVSGELGRLGERIRQLEAELALAKRETAPSVDLDEAALTDRIGEETVRVLHTARESATQIKTRAEENAARLVADATDEVARMRHDAELEVARKRADAAADAEAELALAKQQGREMVNEARAYRERVLADLEARTARARQQLEELAHGRERLLQVFERARLVAIDVSTELGKHPGPAELVDLSNTTGPVPVIVPAAGKPDVGIDDRSVAELAAEPVAEADAAAGSEPDVDATESVAVVATIEPDREPEPIPEPDPEHEPATTPIPEPAPEPLPVPGPEPAPEQEPGPAVPEVDPDNRVAPEADPAEQPENRDNVVALFARLREETVTAASDDESPTPLVVVPSPARPDDASVAEPVDDTPFTRRAEALTPLIVSAARKLKRVLADEQNGVLDVLRGRQAVTAVDALLPGPDDHAGTYAKAIDEELTAAAKAGAGEAGGKLGKSAVTALDVARQRVKSELVGALRERLERSVNAGTGDNADITRGVRNVYREWKTQHIDEQLDDVFRAAFAGGAAASIKPGALVVWRTEPGHIGCADCADNTLAGAVPAGQEFPTGHVAAPAHPGCRCLVLPA